MIITIAAVIVSVVNLLKVYIFFDGEKIFAQTSAGVMLFDLLSNRFLHFEEQLESFPVYVADYSLWEKSVSS